MRRLWVLLLGFFLVLIGLLLVPLPGPGWLVILSGLGILAKEFGWARRALMRLRAGKKS